jgi:hypothetical protein
VPVNELTAFYVNVLLSILNEEFGYMLVDERNGFAPAGLARFGKSKGGYLFDDPNDGRVITVQYLEAYILEMASVEQGLMLQTLQLAAEALGLGGFAPRSLQDLQGRDGRPVGIGIARDPDLLEQLKGSVHVVVPQRIRGHNCQVCYLATTSLGEASRGDLRLRRLRRRRRILARFRDVSCVFDSRWGHNFQPVISGF